ncbi:hypothetical protein PybrP1_007066 [[Pythium] brassicae (nom. inval.)]|nr:hypothetical protein PybrP1_007066 [[Pythium] brassicae (nom. inval.)]
MTDLTVRVCSDSDVAGIEALQWPSPADQRRLFGRTHTGALVETAFLALAAERPDHRLVAFAAFDDKIPTALAQWPEATEYLRNKLLFGRPNGCVLLSAFSQEPPGGAASGVLNATAITHLLAKLFRAKSGVGGVVLAVSEGVDLEELGLFGQLFSHCDPVFLGADGLVLFYRVARSDFEPSVVIRDATARDLEQLAPVLEKNQMQSRLLDGASHKPWFDARALSSTISNQDQHRACFVAQRVGANTLGGVLACTDSISADLVGDYARLFGDLYRQSAAPWRGDAPTTGGHAPKIVLCGPTGAGKGTQCAAIVDEFGVLPLSTGEMLRAHMQQGSALGVKAQAFIGAGELVPDELMLSMLLERLGQDDCRQRGWVLDGFPRTEMQARVMLAHGVVPDVVLVLDVPDAEILRRAAERLVDPLTGLSYHSSVNPAPAAVAARVVRRPEDAEHLVRKRIATYREHRAAVHEAFAKKAVVVHVDGARSRASVAQKITRDIYHARGLRRPLTVRQPPKLVISGPPAGGKGTQCERIVKAFRVVHLSTGDMLRAAIQANAPLGLAAKAFMDAGELVPDDLIIDLILARLQRPDCVRRGWLLDGFPRTRAQAQALLSRGIVPDAMLILEVPDDDIVQRIAGRVLDPETGKTYHVTANPPPAAVASRCIVRSDDNADTVRVRLQTYHANCAEVRRAFASACDVVRADGTQAIERIAEQFVAAVEHCLLRNNCVAVTLFGADPSVETQTQLFLARVFERFSDKDCVLLRLPDGCSRPAIASGFRSVRADTHSTTISRITEATQQQRRTTSADRVHAPQKGHSLAASSARTVVLYAFHRDELPFLNAGGVLFHSADDDAVRKPEPVVVKGLGVRGIGRVVKVWGSRCWEGVRTIGGGKRSSASCRGRSSMP